MSSCESQGQFLDTAVVIGCRRSTDSQHFRNYRNISDPTFQYISNKMQLYTVYLYLETALHVSGSNSTRHQEREQLYLQHLVIVTPLLLPAAIASNGGSTTRNM
jgi:hypothetical protein